jgi:hypothetical protein
MGKGGDQVFESIFSARRLLRLVRSGDSRRFGLELEADGEAIIAQIAADAASRLVPMAGFITAKVKRKDCVAYNAYPENIVLRAVANYVARRFRVVATSRDRIIRGVIEAMFDQTPIYVIRRDLASFYETVPLEPVRNRLLYDTAVPRSVRHYLREFYEHHCGTNIIGLPRGVGLTTVLVELAMQPFDDEIRSIPGVYRYFRYSDDMLILTYKEPEEVKERIEAALKKLPGMAYNKAKSDEYAFAGDAATPPDPLQPSTASFDFLGYRFTAEQRIYRDRPRKLWVSIASKKTKLMKTRVYLSLKTFLKDGDGNMLVDRLRVLTGNYRINRRGINAIRRSRYIYAGIYYNYWRCGEYINGVHRPAAPESLRDVDRFLHGHMKTGGGKFRAALSALPLPQRRRLDGLSFERGFEGRRMVRMPFQRFSKLKAIWRNA